MKIGIDLGGSKIEAILLDRGGEALWRERILTPSGNYDAILRAVAGLIAQAEAVAKAPCSVGIGAPGSPSPVTGLMRNCNSTCLNGRPLQQDLEALLERPLRVANDADCFALAEAVDGAGRNAAVVFGVILGTGTGGGVVAHGRLLKGANAIGGEWGHNPLPVAERAAPACYCGRAGCVETWLSGPGLSADHAAVAGESLDAAAIATRAEAGDAACMDTLARYEARLARGLATVINILDPDVVVLGGGLSNIRRLYANVPRLWGAHIFSDSVRTRLLPNRHGDSGGVLGAARLWDD